MNNLPNTKSKESKKQQVEQMFNHISGNYDQVNRLITFGMDVKWRKRVLKIISEKNPENILDVATGTGDMAILFSKTSARTILGVDISEGMLEIADQKINSLNLQHRIETSVQDSEALSIIDNSFDAVSVSYGIRNFENLNLGLSEIYRVLKKTGVFVILETSVPENYFLKAGFKIYTNTIMPNLAKIISKEKNAYSYLSRSASNFPYGQKMKDVLQDIGFKNVKIMPQFFGASTIYYAEK